MHRAIPLIIAAIILAVQGTVYADVKDDLKGIKKEIKEKKNQLKKAKKIETKVSGELEQIQKSLREKEKSLIALNRDLKLAESNLDRTQNQIEAVKADAERKKQQVNRRRASLYKAGEFGGTRMFFSSDSFPQMLENIRYMQAVTQNDKKIYNEYVAKIEQLRGLKDILERDADRKEKIKTSIEIKKNEIVQEKNKKADYLAQIKQKNKMSQTQLKELEANARRLQSMVERLEARSRKSYTHPKDNRTPSVSGGGTLTFPDKGFGSQRGRLSMPVRGEVVSSFGRHKHAEFNSYTVSNGISISAPQGSEIHSVYDGQVIFADYFKGYGNMIIIDHGGGFFSLYGHASKILKRTGASVARNDVVASVGDVDSTKGPMLYFEIRYQGKPIDPAPWLR